MRRSSVEHYTARVYNPPSRGALSFGGYTFRGPALENLGRLRQSRVSVSDCPRHSTLPHICTHARQASRGVTLQLPPPRRQFQSAHARWRPNLARSRVSAYDDVVHRAAALLFRKFAQLPTAECGREPRLSKKKAMCQLGPRPAGDRDRAFERGRSRSALSRSSARCTRRHVGMSGREFPLMAKLLRKLCALAKSVADIIDPSVLRLRTRSM